MTITFFILYLFCVLFYEIRIKGDVMKKYILKYSHCPYCFLTLSQLREDGHSLVNGVCTRCARSLRINMSKKHKIFSRWLFFYKIIILEKNDEKRARDIKIPSLFSYFKNLFYYFSFKYCFLIKLFQLKFSFNHLNQ